MRKWLFALCTVLFFDCMITGILREKTTFGVMQEAGMPVERFKEAGVPREEMKLYLGFWKDLQYFPAAGSVKEEEAFSFVDSWHTKRSFKGERLHEGCDIFGSRCVTDYYPVISMTDGKVEKIGWLPLGGWRIGIRSPGGGYFYYAHLSSYGRNFKEGEQVKAGEILGFIGNSGYGEEGTAGKFPPHLHLGIYVRTKDTEEYALNPYPLLQFLQNKQKNFFY